MWQFLRQLKANTEVNLIHFCLGLLILATCWSLLRPEFFRVHDFTQAARISEMTRALSEGHFPVRWSQNLGYGYGMPLFNFYAPLPYYIGALIYSLGFDVVWSIKLLYLLAAILTAAGAFQLGKAWYGRWGGVLTAAAFTLAPYRAVNLFVRGALSEAWAMAFLPLIIWGLTLVIRADKSGWKWLVIGLTGLFLSHNITTLLFLPISGLIGIGLVIIEWRKKPQGWSWQDWGLRFWWLLSGYLIAILLAAFYLFPAFFEKDFTKFASTIFSGYFDYHLHFLYLRQLITPYWGYGGSGWGPEDGISFFLGFGQLLGLLLMILVAIWPISKSIKKTWFKQISLPLLALGIFGLSSFFSLQRSMIFWEKIPLLALAQFPWRWLSIASLGLALGIGALGALTPKVWWRSGLLWLVFGSLFLSSSYFQPEFFLSDNQGLYYTDPIKIQNSMSDILPDYIPKQMAANLTPPPNLWLNPDLKSTDVEVIVNRTHEKLLRVTQSQPIQLELAVADFPAWGIELDGQAIEKSVGELGNISLIVPAGSHLVGVVWQSTLLEQVSNFASLIGFGLVLALGLQTTEPKLSKFNKNRFKS